MFNIKLLSVDGLKASNSANLGMVLMIIAMFLLPVGDTLAKLLTDVMSPLEVTMWRFSVQSIFLMPVAYILRRRLRGYMFSPIVAVSGGLIVIRVDSMSKRNTINNADGNV